MTDTSQPGAGAPQAAPPAGPSAPPAPPEGRGWTVLAPLALALLSIALYLPTLEFPLVYDDAFLIGNNASMQPVASDWTASLELFRQEYWEGTNPDQPSALRVTGQALYRPLTLFLWACVVAVQKGVQPTWTFHLLNVAANAVVVVLLYQLVRRLWGSPRVALAAALLFALHPLHSEAVAYVAGLSDVLSALAVLLGLLLWERATRAPGQLAMRPFMLLMATLFVGLLAKEQVAVLIAAVALTDVMLALRGENRGGWPRTAVYVGLLLVLGLHLALRYAAVGYLQPSTTTIGLLDNPLIQEPFGIRLMNGVKLLAFQIWLFLWPARLSVDYSFDAIPTSRSWSQAEPLAAGVLIAVLLVHGLVMLRRRPAVGWGTCFFLGTALFTSNILVPIGTLFGERLTYLSTAGLCLALAAAVDGLLGGRRAEGPPAWMTAVGLLLLLGAAAGLGARTLSRNRDFSASEILFESAAEVVPDSARVHFQLGALLAGQQIYGKAEEHYTRTLVIHPSMLQAALGLANVHLAAKNWETALAVYDDILAQLLATRSDDPTAQDEITRQVYTSRSAAKAGKGDLDGAAADLRLALQLTGGPEGDVRVGPHLQLARLLADRGKPQEAIPVLRQALALQPGHVDALYLMAAFAHRLEDEEAYGQALDGLEKTERGRPFALALRAEAQFEQALAAGDETGLQAALAKFEEVRSLLPQLATPYVFRGRYFLEKGRFADAVLELDRALERSLRLPVALLCKARALTASGRPKEALAAARELEIVAPDADCYTLMFRTHFLLQDTEQMLAVAGKLEELGVEAVNSVLDLSIELRNAGRLDDAIAAVEVGRMLPGGAGSPDLLRNLGVLLIEADRPDEALAILDLQEAAEQAIPERLVDPFLPINRARCLMALGCDLEAAAQLELFEVDVVPGSKSWLSLAHRRTELFLRRGSALYDPAQAVELSQRGLDAARDLKVGSPPLLDASIEALAAAGDFAGALARAKEARAQYPDALRYRAAESALQLAVDGNVQGAVEALRKTGDRMLGRVAAQLAP